MNKTAFMYIVFGAQTFKVEGIKQERNQDFAKGGAWKWKILWSHFDDVFSL